MLTLTFARRARAVCGAALLAALTTLAPGAAADDLQDSLRELATRHHVCAAAVAVVREGQLARVVTASGCPDTATPDADSVFQAASLSKPVFAYAVLRLAAGGRLDLDAPLVRYLPQGYLHRHDPLKAAPAERVTLPALDAVTARMVLNHTTGLPNWAGGPLRFDSAPGARWAYSGEGYVLLQRAVEAITGEDLEHFMANTVFAPLGMRHSSYVLTEALRPALLPGTKANGAPRRTLPLAEAVAAFSLHTSAGDYGRFLAAQLRDGSMLDLIAAAPVPVDAARGLRWGLGWGMARTAQASYLWQWGNNPGYRAFVMAAPATGNGFVLLTNSENGLSLAEPLAHTLLPDEHRVFTFPWLGDDVITGACKLLRLCL